MCEGGLFIERKGNTRSGISSSTRETAPPRIVCWCWLGTLESGGGLVKDQRPLPITKQNHTKYGSRVHIQFKREITRRTSIRTSTSAIEVVRDPAISH